MSESPDLTDLLAEGARSIHQATTLDETLDAIVHAARTSLPGINHAGISVGHRTGRIETMAATDEVVRQLDDLQHDLREGPCVYAAEKEVITRVEHVKRGDDPRWPNFLPRAAELGLRSQLGVRLHMDDDEIGALNLYSTESDTLDEGLEDIAELFATYAAVAMGRALREEQLATALITRRLIGQAIGIVMERFTLDDERAFAYLVRLSNASNTKLRDIAQKLVDDAIAKGQAPRTEGG